MQSDFLSSQHFALQFHRIQRYMIYKHRYIRYGLLRRIVWLRETSPPPSPLAALSLLCRLFPLRRRDDLFGQIVQLALLLFRCISCNYWPNGANRLQIAFRESCHSRISTYYTGREISGESCRQHQQRQQQGATSCGAQLSVLSWRLAVWSSSNNNYRKLTSFHQQQERSFPELPAG